MLSQELPLPIIDLHCDLLSYLADDVAKRSVYDPVSHCSVTQLKAGMVALQTLAIFSITHQRPVEYASRQVSIFSQLTERYPEIFQRIGKGHPLDRLGQANRILIVAAIENASGFCSETDSILDGLRRFDDLCRDIGPILYVTMTWNDENRFGGGCLSTVGLKEDGKRLLDVLSEKNIAVDFSHMSDALAHDVLNYIDRYNSPLRILASHSNYRAICDVPRNLPNDIAKEIFKRGGVIGLNAVQEFIGGGDVDMLAKHIAHAYSLDGQGGISFGADFFYELDVDPSFKAQLEGPMFPAFFENPSCYPGILTALRNKYGMSNQQLCALAFENANRFITYEK